ncbi:MAG TPA: hypothetical protein VHD39_03955, partial [Acidimicrobiales bacterium]|nr:hypothetical protein [Acidimicrobiales bacterium]
AERPARTGPAASAPPVAEPPPPATPPAPVGSRPSLGAVQRSKRAAAESTTPPASIAPEPVESEPVAPEPAGPETGTPPAAGFDPPAPVAAAPPGPAASPASGSRIVDRDSLTEAWGDGILQSLPARAKARFASGRFVAVDEQGAHFALPNAAHRDQCAEQVPLVESALASHFGTAVTLVLVIDDTAAPAARTGSAAASPPPAPEGGSAARRGRGRAQKDVPPPPPPDEYDEVDPAEFAAGAESGGPDQATEAEARLLQAFPGASEVLS